MEYMEQQAQMALDASIQRDTDMTTLLRALLRIAKRNRDEGGCYYSNRNSIDDARDALKAVGIDWRQ